MRSRTLRLARRKKGVFKKKPIVPVLFTDPAARDRRFESFSQILDAAGFAGHSSPFAFLESHKNATTLITCHINADFDAFAALIAAHHLYEGAVLLFPGTQEKLLHEFYHDVASVLYNFKKADQIEWDSITRLVLVDTRQRSRLPHIQPLLDRNIVDIHIWDHHPDSSDDIVGSHSIVLPVGACTTLLVYALREMQKGVHSACAALCHRSASLCCQDATVLGLGIYADTGSFTFSSATPTDFLAAAWLKERGMDVNAIAALVANELTSAHVQALNALLESATTYAVGEVTVVIAEVSMESYLGDFALLAHKLMEMERFLVLFAVGRMGDRITVVARSRSDAINVGAVCTSLGGGGHAYAASASVRDKTIFQVRESILHALYVQSYTEKCARDYMSAPPLGIEVHKTMHDAHEFMTHFDVKAILVFARGSRQCVGILDAHTASRAVNHQLDDIETYTDKNVRTLPPDASLADLIQVIMNEHQHLVPIVDVAKSNDVVGVVTRTDLIDIFVENPKGTPIPLGHERKVRSLTKLLRDRLPKHLFTLLEHVGDLGDTLGFATYVVGGFVRDVLLERANFDIDIVVEGNGLEFARELARELGGRVREHAKFMTSIVIFDEDRGGIGRIDVATARLEYYEQPAALPTVEHSSIKLDLLRRDFTINALAIHLGKQNFGQLVDFFGGQRDILDKKIRVLHTLSFVEDPSRCLRAVRFEQRYAFKLGLGLERLIKNALTLKLMDKLSGARLLHELQMIFAEQNPVCVLSRLYELGILQAIHPQLQIYPRKLQLLQRLRDIVDWYKLLYFSEVPERWIVYMLGMCCKFGYKDCAAILTRIGLARVQQQEFLQLHVLVYRLQPNVEAWSKKRTRKVSKLCDLLEGVPLEALLYIMAKTSLEKVRMYISRYITTWKHEKLDINGGDVLGMGLASGPRVGIVLRMVKAAKLDGAALSREQQLALARKWVRKLMRG